MLIRFRYCSQDDLPGIAISYNAMMSDFGWSNEAAGKAYCGLEVLVKTSDGRQLTAIIADGEYKATC